MTYLIVSKSGEKSRYIVNNMFFYPPSFWRLWISYITTDKCCVPEGKVPWPVKSVSQISKVDPWINHTSNEESRGRSMPYRHVLLTVTSLTSEISHVYKLFCLSTNPMKHVHSCDVMILRFITPRVWKIGKYNIAALQLGINWTQAPISPQ